MVVLAPPANARPPRAYPFGATLQSDARALLPPPLRLELRQVAQLPGGGAECEALLTRLEGAPQGYSGGDQNGHQMCFAFCTA